MGTRTRRDCAQLNLRMEPAERDRIQAVIPYGSLNSITIQLLMDYVQLLERNGTQPTPRIKDRAA